MYNTYMPANKGRKVNIQFSLPITFLREGKYFIAHTPALDISTSAKTFKKAKQRFEELIEIYLEELIEIGTLEEVLTEQGWQKIDQKWQPPTVIASQNETVELPLHLLENVSTHSSPNQQI
jgi:predicted RNase H-like HicB family nuclease